MADGVPYTIHGVKVMFPCKAYPTQLSMMDRIMKGLERHQHCLLESPTGSGKSLALLCSCLAWQMAEYEKSKSLKEEKNSDESTCCDTPKPSPVQPAISSPAVIDLTSTPPPAIQTSPEVTAKTEDPINTSVEEEDGEDDFRSDSKRFRTPITSKSFNIGTDKLIGTVETPSTPIHPPEWRMEVTKTESPVTPPSHDSKSPTGSDSKKKSAEKIMVPKIYFGTRTHKQVSQIARELGKTAYKKAKMCILSSREHSCIHPKVSKNSNKNEECRKLLDPSIKGETCFYYQKMSVIGTQAGIKSRGLEAAWDIEDLVRVGKKARACPYYSARELMKEADIIFCPYNYLIDPKIRYQMDIDLKDQIVVLDEAHNVEDSARDSASLTIDTVDLQDLLGDLDKMIQWKIMITHYQSLHLMCANLMRWIDQNSEGGRMKDRGFEQAVLVHSGEEILNGLKDAGLTPASCTIYKNIFSEIMAADKDPANNYMKTSPSSQSVSILEGLFLVLGYLFGFNGKFVSDYRLTILKTAHFVRNELPGGWKRAGFGARKEWKYSLNFWCFNPAVVFSRIGAEARSIILTSGTLSPMSSFASELGVPFPIKLEANHVIANSQVWVGTLSVGPSNSPINATFRSAETYSFQDDVGNVVLDVCQKIPHGVLCFFPSYNMLEKVSKRWQSTGLWTKLLQRKVVLCEPRSGGKSDFDDVMHVFYQAIRRSEGEEDVDCTDSDDEGCSGSEGALFLAVCRGKVSEGLDFADNNARAVITIGIPFPNTKDLKVDLKRKYNDAYSSKRGLLNGHEWYEIQAFRALNQALGRCIRHKQDWGAILLVDERFSKTPRYSNGISKWVRQRIHHYKDFHQAVNSLKDFADARQLLPCPATQTPNSTVTPKATAVGGGGFFPESSPNKENCGIPNSACTPLTCKSDISMTDRAFNQSTPGTPLVSANQLAGECQSTPRSHLNSSYGNVVQTPVSSVDERVQRTTIACPTTTPVKRLVIPSNQAVVNGVGMPLHPSTTNYPRLSTPTCVTAQQPRVQGVPLATNITQTNVTRFPQSFANTVTQTSAVRFPQGVQRASLPTNVTQANIRQVIPMATNATQIPPRLIFIPNNSNVAAVNPASGTATTRAQVLYLTPVGINNQLATGQSPLGNTATKVILFTSPNNASLHANTQGNHVNTPGSHVNTQVNYMNTPGSHVNTPRSHVNTQGNHMNTPGSHVNTPGSHVKTPGSHVNTQGNHVNNSGNHIKTVTTVVPNNQPLKQQNSGVTSQNVFHGNKGFVYPTGQTEANKEPWDSQINASAPGSLTVAKDLCTSIKPEDSSTLQTTSCKVVDVKEDKRVPDANVAGRQHSTKTIIRETEVKMQAQNPLKSNQDIVANPLDCALESKDKGFVKSLFERLPVNEVDMYDIECPGSPDLFSTPEESAQPCSKDSEKSSDNVITNMDETTNHDLNADKLQCASAGTGAVNEGATSRCLQPGQPAISTPVKLETDQSKTEESSLSAKKIRIDPNPSSLKTKPSLSNDDTLDVSTRKQPESVVFEDQTDEHGAVDNVVSVRRNLRRTTRRTAKDNLNECGAKDDTIVTREETLHCKQCNSQLYQGVVQQQNVNCQDLTSLYQKFCNPKTRLNKKRKRGGPSVDRVVWTTSDVSLIHEATQALMQQGELFNAMYVPKENTIYIPIQCSCCHTSSKVTSVIGVRVVLHTDSVHKQQVWFFSEAVC